MHKVIIYEKSFFLIIALASYILCAIKPRFSVRIYWKQQRNHSRASKSSSDAATKFVRYNTSEHNFLARKTTIFPTYRPGMFLLFECNTKNNRKALRAS